jgi:hypothetical protein
MCVPGTKVLLQGVACTFGKGSHGGQLYFNAKKMQAVTEPPGPGEAAPAIIAEARSPSTQQASAFLWSMAMKGFFGLQYPEPAHQQQADACKGKWEQLVNGAASKCESVALSFGTDPEKKATVASLYAHATRIKNTTPEDAASGTPIFQSDLEKECDTPYHAVISQFGLTPGEACNEYCGALFDSNRRERVPNSFVEAQVKGIETKGNLVQIDFRLFFLFDKAAAITAIEEGKNPILHSTNAAACVKLTKRSAGPELVGSRVDRKVDMVLREVLPTANQAFFASVFPRNADDVQINSHFAPTSGVDMIDGINKVGIVVSEKWLDEKMLSGRGVFIHSQNDETTPLIEPLPGCGPSPVLKNAGYQAVSENSFDFDSLKVAVGKSRSFRVVYEGCAANVSKNAALASTCADGEAHLDDIITAVREGEYKEFLRHDAVVYCVAV